MPHPCLWESGGILGASQPFLTALCLDFGMGKRQRLTKTVLAQRPPAEGRVEVRDLDSPLIFRLAATGGRSFCVRSYLGPGPKERPVELPIRCRRPTRTWLLPASGPSRWSICAGRGSTPERNASPRRYR